jgi:hypothetical protein
VIGAADHGEMNDAAQQPLPAEHAQQPAAADMDVDPQPAAADGGGAAAAPRAPSAAEPMVMAVGDGVDGEAIGPAETGGSGGSLFILPGDSDDGEGLPADLTDDFPLASWAWADMGAWLSAGAAVGAAAAGPSAAPPTGDVLFMSKATGQVRRGIVKEAIEGRGQWWAMRSCRGGSAFLRT